MLFRYVVSSVRIFPEFIKPPPRREMNDWPPMFKFVVEAVVNEAYVVLE